MENLTVELKKTIDLSDVIINLPIEKQKALLDLLLFDDDKLKEYVYEQHDDFFNDKAEEKLGDKISKQYEDEINRLQNIVNENKSTLRFRVVRDELNKILNFGHLHYLNLNIESVYRDGYICKIKCQPKYFLELFKLIDYKLVDTNVNMFDYTKDLSKETHEFLSQIPCYHS